MSIIRCFLPFYDIVMNVPEGFPLKISTRKIPCEELREFPNDGNKIYKSRVVELRHALFAFHRNGHTLAALFFFVGSFPSFVCLSPSRHHLKFEFRKIAATSQSEIPARPAFTRKIFIFRCYRFSGMSMNKNMLTRLMAKRKWKKSEKF